METCYQVNYQTSFGGDEVFTRAVCRALAALGRPQVLFVHREAKFWDGLGLEGVECVPIGTVEEIDAHLPAQGAQLLTHNLPDAATAARWGARHRLAGFLHMPLWQRDPEGLDAYRLLLPVSAYVAESARARGLSNVHGEPLLGVADLAPRGPGAGPIRRGPLFDPDARKPRDRLVAAASALGARLRGARAFERGPGLTLGIVSRLTPIKQFPLLFSILAPRLAARPGVRLEVFGSGAYASVRDLRRALSPLGSRARLWGRQDDVAAVYPQLDYLLSGLPEKEALGLNLIESQAAGTPVIAVRAPPFTETVLDGETGYLYRDPREDAGAAFDALLGRLERGERRPDPQLARAHLDKFSATSFATRLARALDAMSA